MKRDHMRNGWCITGLAALVLAVVVVPASGTANGFRSPSPSPAPVEADRTIPDIRLEPVFAQLRFIRPIWLTHAGDGTNRVFVIEQPGRIRVFENRDDVEEANVFLDIRERVFTGHNEEGLLALDFHPDYANNGRFYVYYSAGNARDRRGVLSRFRVSEDDANRADPDSEEIILEIDQPWGNHNGATVLFGPDGYLYVSIGDGGWAGDPRNYSQNLGNLLGTIIRIDVDAERARQGDAESSDGNEEETAAADSDRKAYAIPPDNPFVAREGARPEIWAYGLRNVWRMSFDRDTGDLWAGDVGQVTSEAVYIIRRGENYGWNITEGSLPHRDPDEGEPADPIVDPIIEYGRHLGISITGGYVYRGERSPSLRGVYLYGDYGSGRIWGLRYDRAEGWMVSDREVYHNPRRHIASFGEDQAGEVYVCAFDQYDGRTGRIFRIVEE